MSRISSSSKRMVTREDPPGNLTSVTSNTWGASLLTNILIFMPWKNIEITPYHRPRAEYNFLQFHSITSATILRLGINPLFRPLTIPKEFGAWQRHFSGTTRSLEADDKPWVFHTLTESFYNLSVPWIGNDSCGLSGNPKRDCFVCLRPAMAMTRRKSRRE